MTTRKAVVVDDHPAFRDSVRELLELVGVEVIGEAGDGSEAVAAVGRHHPDVVMLDVNLPDCSAFDIAPALADAGGPLIVFMSARQREDYPDLLRDPAALFVAKADLTVGNLRRLLDGA